MNIPTRRQRGAALIVSLIMLLLITILAVTAFRLGKTNLQVVGNIQQRNQAIAAAQFAIDTTISSIQFTETPSSPIEGPCSGTNIVCVSYTGTSTTAGTGEIQVKITPTCDSIQPITVGELSWSDVNDQGCLRGVNSQLFGVSGAASDSNDSMCSNSVWNIQAVAADSVTGASTTVDEGAGVRVSSSTVCP